MSRLSSVDVVVLRDALLQTEAVRVGRLDRYSGSTAGAPASVVAQVAAAPDILLEEALVAARKEGARLGREEGLRAGFEEGRRKGEAEAQEVARVALEKAVEVATVPLQERERALVALLESLNAQQVASQRVAEEEAVALAYDVLCRVLGSTLLTPDGVRAQAAHVKQHTGARELTIHVNPADAELLSHIGGAVEGLLWIPDPAVTLGGCIVQGPRGGLDARLETILEQCRDGLLEVRAQRQASAGGLA